MKRHSLAHRGIMIFGVLLLLGAHMERAAAKEGAVLKWPRQWTVFAPFDRKDALPPEATLTAIPAALEIDKRAVAPRTVAVTDPFGRVDLSTLLGGSPTDVKAEKVAYAFLEIESSGAQKTTIGMGR